MPEEMELLNPYMKASYPVLYMLTAEEARAEDEIMHAAKAEKREKVILWSCTDGLLDIVKKTRVPDTDSPVKALETALRSTDKKAVYVFRDLHRFFDNAKVVRLLRDIAQQFKQGQRVLIIISAVNKIPPELERDVTLIEYKLPSGEQLMRLLNQIVKSNEIDVDENRKQRMVDAALGLTTIEAENAMAKAFIESAKTKIEVSDIVMREKAMTVKKTGILEYFEASDKATDIGGLLNLKKWLDERKRGFTKEAREFGLPSPRGCVLVGLPGCGKSLSAKVAANVMGVPLIRFDISRVFAGLVGQSEQNMRTAINTIEAIGNCVVWVDEMEKAFAGAGQSQSGDSGVTQRVFGTFLSWMQEKKSPSFIVATVNRIGSLPPELLRKGRFDEIFFVDLPDDVERDEILRIHIKKRGRDVSKLVKDAAWKSCVEESKGYSGAELEEAVITGLYKAFNRDAKKDLQMDYVHSAILNTVPVSKSQESNLKSMVDWAQINAVPASVRKEETDNMKLRRHLDL